MNYLAIAAGGLIVCSLFSVLYEGSAEVKLEDQPLVSKNDVLQQVQDASLDSGITVRLITSDRGFFIGGIAPVSADGTSPGPNSRALLLEARKDMTIHNMYLCSENQCIWNEARGPGPLLTTGLVPQYYYFSGLGEVEWMTGEKVHVWVFASEGVDDNLATERSNAKWFDLGLTSVQPCEEYGHWCFPS